MLRSLVVALIAGLLAWIPGEAVATRAPAHLQVVAHPDDDLLFMNPDLALSIRSGAQVTTVFLTAGESDIQPAAEYAASRAAGTRAAFAAMAGVTDDWRSGELALPGGRQVAVHTLRARPTVRLIQLGLPDDNDPHATGGRHALIRLWHDPDARASTIPPAPTVVYDRGALIGTLAQLYRRVRPTIVRTLDPRPDARYQSQWSHHDHTDHVMTARFAGLALRAWPGAAPLVHYRGYNIADAAPNLPPGVVTDKRAIFARYAPHDSQVSMDEPYTSWLRGMRQRRPWGTHWANSQDGRITYAYVRAGRLVTGTGQTESIVGTAGFEPSAAVVMPEPGTLLAQDADSGEIFLKRGDDSWRSLGGPPADRPRTHLGAPAAITTPQGRLLVAVRNRHGGVSVRFTDQPEWTELGGTDVEDTVSVLLGGTGDIHVLATTPDGLLHWRVGAGGDAEPVRTAREHRPAGTIATTTGFAAFREADTGKLILLAERAGWAPVTVPDTEAVSDPAIALPPGAVRPVIAVRNAAGRLDILQPDRIELPGQIQGQPAITPDGRFLTALGDDGKIHVRNWPRPPWLPFPEMPTG